MKQNPNRRERRWAQFQALRKSSGNNRKTTAGRINQYVVLANGKTRRIQHKTMGGGAVKNAQQLAEL